MEMCWNNWGLSLLFIKGRFHGSYWSSVGSLGIKARIKMCKVLFFMSFRHTASLVSYAHRAFLDLKERPEDPISVPRSDVIPTLCHCPHQQLRTQPDFHPEHKGFSQRCITTIVLLLQGFQLFFLEAIITVQVSRSMRLEYKKISFCISRNVRTYCLMHMERMSCMFWFSLFIFWIAQNQSFCRGKKRGVFVFPTEG